jgi:hypothetical protein
MKGTRGSLIALFMLGALGRAELSAQSVEFILRYREELELTEQQIQQLDALRREMVQARSAEMAEMAELRSQLAAGSIRESQVMALRERQQDAQAARAEQRQARIDQILTLDQREELLTLRRQGLRGRGVLGPRRPGIAPGRGLPGGPRRGPRGFGLR